MVLTSVAVAVCLAVIEALPVVVVLLGVVVLLLDLVPVWLAGLLLEVAVAIAHGHSFASSVEVPGELLVDSAILGHANDVPYSHLSIEKALCHERKEPRYSMPNLSDRSASDTIVLPTDATTSHRRRRDPPLSQGQRRHP